MQLKSWLGAAVALAILGGSSEARAGDSEVTTRLSSEVAGYTDSVGVNVVTPSAGATVESPTSGWGVDGRYLVDIVTAASPDIVATASPRWREVRNAGSLGGRYKPGTFGVAAGVNASSTPDYLALAANLQLTQELDEKNFTLVEGYSYGHDTIGRTGTPFSVYSHVLTSHAITGGVSRVVNKGLVLGGYVDAIFESGDQSKPYRYIPLFAPNVAPTVSRGASTIYVSEQRIAARPLEQLPLSRDRFALTGRMAYRTESATLRLDERFYGDSWAMIASTTDVHYYVDVSERWTIWPHLRAHVQNGVDFWQRAYTSTGAGDIPNLRTGDRELGPLTSFGLGGGARIGLGKAGAVEDFVLVIAADGTWTSFADALYVKERFSLLGVTSLVVTL
jgi:hypothetical protein